MAAGEDLVGKRLGPYLVERKLGSGATGVVFRAHKEGEPPVAIKVLHDNLGSISGLKRRFDREARVLAKLSHPNIVAITDFGFEDGHTFIAMELLEGRTLEEELVDAPLPPARAIAYYGPILEALAVAHAQEVVHRDLKPANVFLTKDGSLKVLDFGLAKMLSIDELSEEGTLTRKGRIVGTPAYMAPEQITGVFVDQRADVYALGVMLYELLADRRPFLYERRSELLRAHLLEPVPAIEKLRKGLWVHEALESLLVKALAKDPADRFPDAKAMLEALRALPSECVTLDDEARRNERKRTGATSEVISSSERAAITEEALAGGVPKAADPPPVERETFAVPEGPAGGGVSTGALFVIALVLLGAAAALWTYFMMPR